MDISIMKIRRSWDRRSFVIGIFIMERRYLYPQDSHNEMNMWMLATFPMMALSQYLNQRWPKLLTYMFVHGIRNSDNYCRT